MADPATTDAIGVLVNNVTFGLALLKAVDATTGVALTGANAVSYTALKFEAGPVGLVGLDGFDLSASKVQVAVNSATGTAPATPAALNFGAGLVVETGGTAVTLDFTTAAMKVEITEAYLNIADFIQLRGTFVIEQVNKQTIGGKTVAGLAIGASNTGFFAGVGPYWDDAAIANDGILTDAEAALADPATTNAIGVLVNNVTFGLALLKAVDATTGVALTGANAVSYTALKFEAGPVGLVGLDGFDLSARKVQVAVNSAKGTAPATPAALNFGTGLVVETGGTAVTLDFTTDAMKVEITEAYLNIADFIQLRGTFVIEQVNKQTIGGKTVAGLAIGASNAGFFAGVGPYWVDGDSDGILTDAEAALADPAATDAIGVVVNNVTFGLALLKAVDATTGVALTGANAVSYTALKFEAGPVGLVGLDGFDLSAAKVQVAVNSAKGTAPATPAALDFSSLAGGGLQVKTGGSDITLDFTTQKMLVQVTEAWLNISDFVQLRGSFAIEQVTKETINDTSGAPQAVSGLKIGASGVGFFAGIGPYWVDANHDGILTDAEAALADPATTDAVGVQVSGVNFALALLKAVNPTTGVALSGATARSYTALKLHAASAGLVGLDDFMTLEASGIDVKINTGTGAGGAVAAPLKFDATTGDVMAVQTGAIGPEATISLDFTTQFFSVAVSEAVLIVSDFVFVRGGFAFEKSTVAANTLYASATGPAVAATGTADILTIGGSGIDVFVGYAADGFDRTKTLAQQTNLYGFGVENVSFALAQIKVGTTQSFTALKASASAVQFYGLPSSDAFKLQVQEIGIEVNQSTTPGKALDFQRSFPNGLGTADDGFLVNTGGGNVRIDFDSRDRLGLYTSDALLTISEFVYFQGAIGFEKFSYTGTLYYNTVTPVPGTSPTSLIQGFSIGGSGIDVFLGYADGGVDPNQTFEAQKANLYGFGVEGVDFGMAQIKGGGQSFTALKLQADTVKLYGIPEDILQLSAENFRIEVNQSTTPGKALDFHKTFGNATAGTGLTVGTGGDDVVLDFNGGERLGLYTEELLLTVYRFVYFRGSIGFEKSTFAAGTLSNGLPIPAIGQGFTIGGSNIDVFLGYVGGDGTIDETKPFDQQVNELYGFGVEGVDFGMSQILANGITYTALKLHADTVALYGIDENIFELKATDFNVEVNQSTVPGVTLDFRQSLAFTATGGEVVPTGGDDVLLDFSRGERLGIFAGEATLSIYRFVYFQGGIGFQKAQYTGLRLSGAVGAPIGPGQGFAIGGSDIDAFVGYIDGDGTIDRTKTFAEQADKLYGFGVEGVDFGMVQIQAAGGTYTALKAHADTVKIYGFDPDTFELSAKDITIELNQSTNPLGVLNFATSFPAVAGPPAKPAGLAVRTGSADDTMLIDFTSVVIGGSVKDATLNIGGFVYAKADVAFSEGERANVDIHLGSLATLPNVPVNLMTLTVTDASASWASTVRIGMT